MLGSMQKIIRGADAATATAYLSLFRERNALLSFLFHSIFIDDAESRRNVIHPLQRTTVSQFRRFVQYYRSAGYRFIAPADLLAGLEPDGRYALISFDDGYFNNTRVLPILEDLQTPATFFITTGNVMRRRRFWWDVHWSELSARGMSEDAIVRDGRSMKSMTTEQIEQELTNRFGAEAFVPHGDLDRPMTPDELRAFSRHPYVHLGNHTASHAILTNYSAGQVREQVERAQHDMEAMTGARPIAIAYPNGAHSPQIRRTCTELGLRCGFTVEARKTRLPFDASSADVMRIGRFSPDSQQGMEKQCRTFRSDVQVYGTFHSGYVRLRQRRGRIPARTEEVV